MKVFILGHRGMLGHVVVRYLKEAGIEVVTSEHRYSALPLDPLIEEVCKSNCKWVINALGRIKQKSIDRDELFRANVIFPLHLRARLQPDQRILHASSDCVFSGLRGNYQTSEERDATDLYGFSKILSETALNYSGAIIMRVSIIGPLPMSTHGLMSWFLSQHREVSGYVNHYWNGITTLQWAKFAHDIITRRLVPSNRVFQVGTLPPINKYQLLKLIGEVWEHPITIQSVDAPETINRSLIPDLPCPGLLTQLQELRYWYKLPDHG